MVTMPWARGRAYVPYGDPRETAADPELYVTPLDVRPTQLDEPSFKRHAPSVSVTQPPPRVWTRQTPTTAGSYWARQPWAPNDEKMVRLVDSAFGLKLPDADGRLARAQPWEWLT